MINTIIQYSGFVDANGKKFCTSAMAFLILSPASEAGPWGSTVWERLKKAQNYFKYYFTKRKNLTKKNFHSVSIPILFLRQKITNPRKQKIITTIVHCEINIFYIIKLLNYYRFKENFL